MDTQIRLQFVLGTGISSKAIAWFSAGHFSHVDAVMDTGELLGARSDRPGGTPAGVQVRPANYETWKDQKVLVLPVSQPTKNAFLAFLHAQVGKPYDSTAIWGFVTGRDWRQEDSWFCSELQTAALEYCGVCPKLYTPSNKVTPATLAAVVSALGGRLDPEESET